VDNPGTTTAQLPAPPPPRRRRRASPTRGPRQLLPIGPRRRPRSTSPAQKLP
jgi:hypothetical protein